MDIDWTRIFTHLISVTVAYLLALPVAWDREKEVSFKEGVNARSLKLDATETFDIVGLKDGMEPREDLTLIIHRQNGETIDLPLMLRIETPVEVEYYRHGGILPYVLRQLLKGQVQIPQESALGTSAS